MVPGTTLYQALLLSLQLLLETTRSDGLLSLPLIPPFLKQEQDWLVRGEYNQLDPLLAALADKPGLSSVPGCTGQVFEIVWRATRATIVQTPFATRLCLARDTINATGQVLPALIAGTFQHEGDVIERWIASFLEPGFDGIGDGGGSSFDLFFGHRRCFLSKKP